MPRNNDLGEKYSIEEKGKENKTAKWRKNKISEPIEIIGQLQYLTGITFKTSYTIQAKTYHNNKYIYVQYTGELITNSTELGILYL